MDHERFDRSDVHPYRDVCNPGLLFGKRWYCAANPNLPVGQSCTTGWQECVPGCNPGRFSQQWWHCPENPALPTGQSCATGWRVCEPNACNQRLAGAQVYVGDYVPATDRADITAPAAVSGHGSAQLLAAPNDPLVDYLASVPVEGAKPLVACGGPIYPHAGQATITVDCPANTKGDFIYVVSPHQNASLSICETQVSGQEPNYFRPAAPVTPFSMIIGSDPQYYWGRNDVVGDDAASIGESQTDLGRETNRLQAAAMNQLLQGLVPVGFSVPEMIILNGDLTELGRSPQWSDFEHDYAFGRGLALDPRFGPTSLAPIVYPGLGNHDYENNVNDCQGQAEELVRWGFVCATTLGFGAFLRQRLGAANR